MTGFELRNSWLGSDHSTNWATTASQRFFAFNVRNMERLGETYIKGPANENELEFILLQ